ncbi:Hpt domain-containing protein [Desulfoluna spongiiphila]|uniref:HPt (Histidine-containing phosphotransfer) domain-containing protein n=1 Tax=Desulfoluna spongiiphila TaxID=419481 RepID=A0A1G5IQK9_9BACT|nr:Hpt domain-containing protein [Desulfoluna spongiiphila]SCY77889.1 HPt (histidine-containing phosphotransfer) domain-containing protein [Desulfoluna spongiiphila]VVS92587.1 signal transduction histidine kinase phosphotransfer (hpt) domain [Desulfoluna spongiiphila]
MKRTHDEAPIDVDELMDIMGGDRALIRECLVDFSRDYEEMIGAIRDASAKGDGESLERAAHALKGSLTYLAARPAAAAAFELEKSGRGRKLMELESKLADLELECGKMWAFLKGFMA